MHQLTGDFYTVGQILGHSLKGIGIQLQLSNNLEAVTAQYVDVRMERKLYVLNIYHEAVLGSSEKHEVRRCARCISIARTSALAAAPQCCASLL